MKVIDSLILSFFVGLILGLIAYKKLLPAFTKFNMNQVVSEYALNEYKDKPVTPTMGGILFVLISILAAIVINGFNSSQEIFWLPALAFFLFFLIGFIDDFKIVKEGKNNGLSEKHKMALQIVAGSIVGGLYMLFFPTTIAFPLFNASINLGWLYVIFAILMMSGSSNAVNITDGVDGLSASAYIVSATTFIIICYLRKQYALANFLAVLVGSLLAYLAYNKKPAKIYMGDSGSLALGGLLAVLGMVLKLEIATIFIGFIFVLETLIVIIQLTSVKLRKKRVFPYTPIHYTFILKGYSENKVVLLFSIVNLIGCLIGLWLGWI